MIFCSYENPVKVRIDRIDEQLPDVNWDKIKRYEL